MSIFSYFKKATSSDKAKERLKMVLSYERKGLPVNFIESIRGDVESLFAKYQQLDTSKIELEVMNENKYIELSISIPFAKNN
ncbi:cell division topological specificity factor MinE [Candidatus Magnetomonas plexicatena]|uniref:cell division topological specificity factor MinE n=1 Tax=Candidatus Magnetomonas plexicatena TaxID=2552947 RepID=UPI001102F354|nr:cell division topological specificity factor MinE [Nitrospirales bacterium LBB_01]